MKYVIRKMKYGEDKSPEAHISYSIFHISNSKGVF